MSVNLVFLATDLDREWFFGGEVAHNSVANLIHHVDEEEYTGVVVLWDKYANDYNLMPQTMMKDLHFKFLNTKKLGESMASARRRDHDARGMLSIARDVMRRISRGSGIGIGSSQEAMPVPTPYDPSEEVAINYEEPMRERQVPPPPIYPSCTTSANTYTTEACPPSYHSHTLRRVPSAVGGIERGIPVRDTIVGEIREARDWGEW